MSKWNAVRTEYGGQVYDSKGEAGYAAHLDRLQAAGAIAAWRRGEPWTLLDGPRRADRITYRPDFEVWDGRGGFRVVDFKGAITREFRLKAKLWRAVYPTVPLYIVRADGTERPA